MKYLLLLLFTINAQSQDFFKDIFKYATFYGAYSQSNSLQGDKTFFVTQSSELQETTVRNPSNQVKTFGFRKLAFFEYEDKNRFYLGDETNHGTQSNIGNYSQGLEYIFQYSKGREQGKTFENKEMFIRYLAKWWLVKAELNENELVDLNYKSAEVRLRVPIGKKISLSVGVIARGYEKAYGYNPIKKYLENEQNSWWSLSYDYGHTDALYSYENLITGETGYDYFWYDQSGVLLSNSDLDYRNNVYGQLVNTYNEEQLDLIGSFADVSSVVGADFYHYRSKYWIHAYANVLPHHQLIKGDSKYSYGEFIGKNNWIDFSYGAVFGIQVNKHLGIFSEITKQRYWDRNIENLKIGINYKL